MIVTYHGHSEFLIELQDGCRVLTDPYDAHVGYPMRAVAADCVLVSHAHGDHSDVSKVPGHPRVVRELGETALSPVARVYGIPSWHDGEGGALRGANTMFLLDADGLRLAHLGDIGAPLTDAQIAALGRVDILMLPVGGHFTVDAAQARDIAAALAPKVVLPMHYKTSVNAAWPIKPLADFLALMPQKAARQPLLRVCAGDISEAPALVALDILG